MDRRLGLRAGCDRQKAAQSRGLAVHFATDFIRHSVRENIVATGTYRHLQALTGNDYKTNSSGSDNQLDLFDFLTRH
jgi:hypothetical protein